MSLQYDPSFQFGDSGNILANTVLNNYPTSPSSVTFLVDVSNSLASVLQVWNMGGSTVSTINGLFYQVFSTSDNVWYDTNPYYPPYTIPTIANSIGRQSFLLDAGKYQIQLTNIDPSHSINVMATTGNKV